MEVFFDLCCRRRKARKLSSSCTSIKRRRNGLSFLVYDKQKEKIAGSTRFYNINFHHKTLSIGYTWYGQEFQRTGLNRHCKLLLLTHAFEVLEMERVEFRADAKNARSITAMQGIGCTLEGTLRNDCNAETGRRDSVVLSIIKSEWPKIKEALAAKIH